MEDLKGLDKSFDELNSKHRKERKELQSTIQSLKKSAAKGDKKKRKEISEEISRLEFELEKRQTEQLNEFQNDTNVGQSQEGVVDNLLESVDLSTSDIDEEPRVSKAQRRRNKKALEEKQREAEILAHEEENKNGPRITETRAIENILIKRNLCIYPISSDGDCLYNAIQHQLKSTGRGFLTVAELRQKTAKYILENKSDLIFYMTNSTTGEFLTDDEFLTYCHNVQNTPAWGGQIEIKALSSELHVPIEVLQASGPPTIQGKEYSGPNLIVTYHRVMYSLGEHYNSTQPLESSQESETNQTIPTEEC